MAEVHGNCDDSALVDYVARSRLKPSSFIFLPISVLLFSQKVTIYILSRIVIPPCKVKCIILYSQDDFHLTNLWNAIHCTKLPPKTANIPKLYGIRIAWYHCHKHPLLLFTEYFIEQEIIPHKNNFKVPD